MFSVGQIVVSAVVGVVVSFVVLLAHARWSRQAELSAGEAGLVAAVVGVSILFWRLAGNVDQLNADPLPLVSPNDALCPVVTYVLLGVYDGFRGAAKHPRWPWLRAVLTLVSLVVNVVTI